MTAIKKNDVLKSKRKDEGDIRIVMVSEEYYFCIVIGKVSVYACTLSELERDYVIPESKWEPQRGERYWYILTTGEIDLLHWQDDEIDNKTKNFLGVYQTKSLAKQALAEIKEKIKK